MSNKLFTISLIIIGLILSCFTFTVNSTPTNYFLIKTKNDWINAGFDPEGLPVYTENGLIDFYMPIAVSKSFINFNVGNVDNWFENANNNFNDRFQYLELDILESDTHKVLLFHMKCKASDTKHFNVDLKLTVKGFELPFGWWNSSYRQRINMEVNATQNPTDLTDFPVLVVFVENETLYDTTNANLTSVVFVLYDNITILNYEVDYYEKALAVVNCGFWVNMTEINGTGKPNTEFHMYFDQIGNATDYNENPEGTWNSGYKFVSHMDGGLTIEDSTSNNNHGTKDGINNPDEVVGMIGNAQDFENSAGDKIVLTSKIDGLAEMSLECWYDTEDDSADQECMIGTNREASIAGTAYLMTWKESTDDRVDLISNGVA